MKELILTIIFFVFSLIAINAIEPMYEDAYWNEEDSLSHMERIDSNFTDLDDRVTVLEGSSSSGGDGSIQTLYGIVGSTANMNTDTIFVDSLSNHDAIIAINGKIYSDSAGVFSQTGTYLLFNPELTTGDTMLALLFSSITPLTLQDTSSSGSYGSELVTNGDFETGVISPWSTKADWNIENYGGDYGYVVRHTAGTANTEPQAIAITDGTTYKVEYDVIGLTAGTCMVSIGNVDGTSRTADGHYSEEITISGSDVYVRLEPITLTFDGAIDNVSVKEVL